MTQLDQIFKFFTGLQVYWVVESKPHSGGVEYLISNKNRFVRFKWYKTSPEEFWFSMHENERCDLVDWAEMFEGEDINTFFAYLKEITTRYLEKETKLVNRWYFFGKKTLKYLDNGKWNDLRNPCIQK